MSTEQITQYLELAGVGLIKPSGDNLIGICPFHEDTHRSFSMNAYTGQWVCFSESCGEYGGLFSFLVKGCGYPSTKAKEIVGEWDDFYGKGTPEGWDVDFPTWADRRRMDDTQEPIAEKLLGLYDFCPRYMKQREFKKETLRRWEIGFDFETERVTFPVRDEVGNLIGISKRTTRNEDPKYLHLGFKRSRVLYGEFFCPHNAVIWTSEGQTDALALWQMGVPYPTSTMSAQVGKRQIKRLGRYSKVVMAFDLDSDGISAAQKVGGVLLEAGHRQVYVARKYPKGVKDPAQLLEKGSAAEVARFIGTLESFDLVRLEWSSKR